MDKAARHYGVPPWELVAHPEAGTWIGRALTAIGGENEGERIANAAAAQRARMKQK